MLRGDLARCLLAAPDSLADQWQEDRNKDRKSCTTSSASTSSC